MILIAIGANLHSPRHGPPLATCEAALNAISEAGVRVLGRSRWYESAPVGNASQPWYVNGVAAVETEMNPADLLDFLHTIEAAFGRRRGQPNAARIIDLDLLAFGDTVSEERGGLSLPHPRMHQRAFVLLPLAELCPHWIHPMSHKSVGQLLAALPPGQIALPMEEAKRR